MKESQDSNPTIPFMVYLDVQSGKKFGLKKRIMDKISYERRVYESVEDRSLS